MTNDQHVPVRHEVTITQKQKSGVHNQQSGATGSERPSDPSHKDPCLGFITNTAVSLNHHGINLGFVSNTVSKLVFYAQSTSTVIPGQEQHRCAPEHPLTHHTVI